MSSGLKVTDLTKGSPAEQLKLNKGDVIVAIKDKAVRTPEEVARALASNRGFEMKVLRPTGSGNPGPPLNLRFDPARHPRRSLVGEEYLSEDEQRPLIVIKLTVIRKKRE
jgi:membrane-associated protease RseP (regulator of RpoE activity)